MPSRLHEMFVEMFKERPEFAAELLAGPLRTAVPDFQRADLSSADLTDIKPTEYRADGVVTFTVDGSAVLAVVIEVQLSPDPQKRFSWPVYVATLYARLRCPVALLVICPDRAVAARCAAPILVGIPGFVLTPLVLGPDKVPVLTDLEVARRSPELAVISALAHGGGPTHAAVFEAMLAGLSMLDADHADLYTDVVLAELPAAARDYLEDIMSVTTHEYASDYARRHFRRGVAEGEAKGEAKGEAAAVLTVLHARGIEVPDDVRERISSCTDLAQLDTWVRRAATADKVHDLFD